MTIAKLREIVGDDYERETFAAHRILTFLASDEAVEQLAKLLEHAVWSPASGPVAWTDDKIARAKKQTHNMALAILDLIASKGTAP